MKKYLLGILVLILVLGCFLTIRKQQAPETAEIPAATEQEVIMEETEETLPPLPDSLLYYGEILKIGRGEDGSLKRLHMNSQRDGEMILNLGAETRFVDSGERKPFDPETLEEGDRVYVFHSPITARSMPPQSPAFAVLMNIPMDASCGMYHLVERVYEEGENTLIVTENGKKVLALTEDSQVLNEAGEPAELESLQEGMHIIAWYWYQGQQVTRASHVMVLE